MKVTCERILVKVQEAETATKTASGLSIPNPNTADGIEEAVVIDSDHESVSEGDRVLIYAGAGKEFGNPETGERLRVVTANEVIIVL